MDIDILINQHTNWKSLIEGLLQGDDANILDSELISKDDECDFGKWIYFYSLDENKNLSNSPLFTQIKSVHKQFHQITGKIIFNFQSDNLDEAKSLIPDFDKTSEELIHLMKNLQ